MTAAVPLDVETFFRRLQRLRATWKAEGALAQCDAILLSLGAPSDFTVYQKTTALFSWLLGYEFPETVMLITKSSVAFLTSPKKGAILDALSQHNSRSEVTVIKREKELGQSGEHFASLWGKIVREAASGKAKIGLLSKDKNEGPMIGEWLAFLASKAAEYMPVDVTAELGIVLAPKDELELQNVRLASKLSSLVLADQLVKKILNLVDDGRGRTTHAQIADEVESFIGNHIGRFRSKLTAEEGASLEYVDVCYPPIIQSGGVYSLKPSAMSTEVPLSTKGGPIICSLGLRHRAYCSNMARTLLIDPSKVQEENLVFLGELQQFLARKLVPGAVISSVYEAGVDFVRGKRPDLVVFLTANFGFGIGIEFRAPEYVINAKCTRTIESGMTFNLMVGLQDVSLEPHNTYSLMLADTIHVVDQSAAVFLTDGFKRIQEVSFSFKRNSARDAPAASTGSIIKTRLRSQGASSAGRDKSSEKQRREHQRELGTLRIKEALDRYGSANSSSSTDKKSEALKFESYRKDSMLPRDLGAAGSLKIVMDKRAETVILPIYGLAVPFHINTIKNVTKNDEGDYSYLRINFNSPGRTFGKKENTPAFEDATAHFVRGITLRTADVYHAQEVFKEIQELRKQISEREAARRERADLVEQGQLVEITGRRPVRLSDIYVRPGLDGKRLPGDVEIHSNGIRYRTQLKSDQKIDVLFANVKHFFFQPCDHETLVLVHFHLHHPIMVGKKKTKDIQFFREALESTVDETSGRRTKMRFGDEDEIAQEQEERRRRAEANDEFRSFAEKVVDASRNTLEVDVPFRELGFSGVPARQNVLLQPTTDCLVHLIEPPFTILTLAEVEVAFFERVVFGLKNFDLVFVFKDHTASPVHVNTIPMTQLEAVKEWLDSVDVYCVESKVNFNWSNIMKTVNEDPVGFYEMGGWTYLQPDEAGIDGSDASDDGSSEYEPDEEDAYDEDESDEEEDDDAVGDEEEDSEETEQESDYDDGSEEEEESDAPDWDDLEEEARRADEKRGQEYGRKRSAPPAPARPPKRR